MSTNREAWKDLAEGAGFRWEAVIFLAMWEEIEARYGREVARDIGADATERAGKRLGRKLAEAYGANDLSALRDVWEGLYPPSDEGNAWDGNTFTVRGDRCFIRETYEQLDIPDDLRRELYAVFCNGDRAFVNGFNPQIHFAWGGRIMHGDPQCVWRMSSSPFVGSPSESGHEEDEPGEP